MDLINILLTGTGGLLLGFFFRYLAKNQVNKTNEYIKVINMQRHDITRLNNKVEVLRGELNEKERLLTLLESSSWDSPFSYWLKDTKGNYVYVNRSFEVENKIRDVLGKTDIELFGDELGGLYRGHDKALLDSNEDYMIFTDELHGKIIYKWKRRAGNVVIGVAGLCAVDITKESI